MKRILLVLLSCTVLTGCGLFKGKLEPSGAYAPTVTNATGVVSAASAPDKAFYTVDAAYALAYATVDGVFTWEKQNRQALWQMSPQIKHTLDQLRPQAVAVNVEYLKARAAYKALPVPANLTVMQQVLAKMHQLMSAVSAVVPKG